MHARKIRYDDSFIVEEDQTAEAESAQVTSVSSPTASFVPSPARQLHQQLEEQFVENTAVNPTEKYSGLSSISIIVGSCGVLWTGLIAIGFVIFQ